MQKSGFLFASIVFCSLIFASFTTGESSLTKKERKYAAKILRETQQQVEKAVKGLSDAQLKFKPSADVWSVEECMKHIAMTEKGLRSRVDALLQQPANPEKRSSLTGGDEDVVKKIEDRSYRVKTSDPMKPENTPFQSVAAALKSFRTDRENLVNYVNTTEDDLRNHIAELPFGTLDAYQLILFIAGHSNRHMQQMQEVKSHPEFPAN